MVYPGLQASFANNRGITSFYCSLSDVCYVLGTPHDNEILECLKVLVETLLPVSRAYVGGPASRTFCVSRYGHFSTGRQLYWVAESSPR